MLPLWLVYLLVILVLLIDALLMIGMAAVGLFLIAYIMFNVLTHLLGIKIDRYIKGRLDRLREDAGARSQDKANAIGLAKTTYSTLYLLYKIYDIASGLIVGLIAVVLLFIGAAALAIVNLALLWLLHAYVL